VLDLTMRRNKGFDASGRRRLSPFVTKAIRSGPNASSIAEAR
jgi:hypothetical protein